MAEDQEGQRVGQRSTGGKELTVLVRLKSIGSSPPLSVCPQRIVSGPAAGPQSGEVAHGNGFVYLFVSVCLFIQAQTDGGCLLTVID